MKVLIFLEHDVVIRHFVQSGVFRALTQEHDVTFVFPEVGHKRVTMDVAQLELGAPSRRLPVHQARQVMWKRVFQVDSLRWRPGPHLKALRRFYRYSLNGFTREWTKTSLWYTVLGLPGIYSWFRQRSLQAAKSLPYHALDDLLDELRPDVLVHPCVLEGVFINDLVDASRARGIPLVAIMNSWDNPCTKRAMVAPPDWLLVWGEQTKRHAVTYVGTAPERTVKFGAAQFEVHRQPPQLTREEFCRRHQIDPRSRIVLYAGSSKDTDEFEHLVEIEQAIDEGRWPNTVVVYRPHPWGNGGREGHRLLERSWRHVRIEETMRAYLERVRDGDTRMTFPDYRHTHEVLSHIDALVSPLSTIILEGALHGKPVMCFLPSDEAHATHFQLVAPLVHFEDLFHIPDVIVARGRRQLVPGLERLLNRIGDAVSAQRLRQACEFFVEPFEEPYGVRLVRFLESLRPGFAQTTPTINDPYCVSH